MLLPRCIAFVSAWLASLTIGLAGNYLTAASAQGFDHPDGTTDLGDGSVIGSDQKPEVGFPVAGVYGGGMRLLARAVPDTIGSFKLPDLDPGNVIKAFDIKFNVVMDKDSGSAPAEGWSLNFGAIPGSNGSGEAGFPPLKNGMTISFDTLDGGGDPTSIQILVGSVTVTNVPRTFLYGGVSRLVVIHWDTAGLDMTFDGKAICTDLLLPGLAPSVGDRFAFSARSTASSMDLTIDNLKVTTAALPAIDTGGVVISEFVARNSTFEDEYAEKPGWLELLNGTSEIVDLTGWYLTDSPKNLKKWRIEGAKLSPYNYQVVYASGRDRQLSSTSLMHANFKLANDSGYIALVRPDGTTVASEYTYGPQQPNVAYGEKGPERTRGFLFPATPGTVNSTPQAPAPRCAEVTFSHPGGLITGPVTLTLGAPEVAGVEIRYTLDRTEPGPASLLYTNDLSITAFTTVRARAFAPNYLPGPVTGATYVFLDATLTNYNGSGKVFDSNLPLVFLDSYGVGIDGSTGNGTPYRPTYAVVIQPDPATGRASLLTTPDYAGPAGTHVRGESSSGFDQKSYAFELWDQTSSDTPASLLGMPANSDWVLYGPWSEKSFMRNKLVFDWMRELRGEEGMAVRTRFIELFFNQSKPVNGKVSYTAAYRGVYVLMEKLKRGSERVPLANLNDKTVDPGLITGGYIIRHDKDDALKNNWTTPSPGLVTLQSFDPDKMNGAQFSYIKGFMGSVEAGLSKTDFKNPRTGFRANMDPDTFIDAQWLLEIAKQVDGYVFSTYFHKDRYGRLRAGPLWDFNIALGNADYGTGDRPTGWLYDTANGTGQLWYPRMHQDPEYRLAHWDRYWQIRRGIFATATVLATIDRHQNTLLDGYTGLVSNRAPATVQNAVARHFRKWPTLGIYYWPNSPTQVKAKNWQGEVDYLKTWLTTRLDWLDDQSLRVGKVVYRPPVLSHPGGSIASPVELTMGAFQNGVAGSTYPVGTVYYTVDRSDPRLIGGAVNPAARAYTGPITIGASTVVNARLYNNGTWSPLATSTFVYDAVPAHAGNLVISEILYRPALPSAPDLAAGVLDSAKYEFLELRNIGQKTVDLAGVRVTDGVRFEFQQTAEASRFLKPGESVVLVSDKRAFSFRYPQVPVGKVAGQFVGQLSDSGEQITLLAADGSVIQDFSYSSDSPWATSGDDENEGRSIVLDRASTNPKPGDPFNWLPSARPGGTPGVSGTGATLFLGDATKDSDGDGLRDLFEFAAGSDPEDPESGFPITAKYIRIPVGGTTAGHLTLSFHRNPLVQGVRFQVQSSADLQGWADATAEMVLVDSVANNDGTQTETYRTAAPLSSGPTGGHFLRLSVILE